MTESNFSRYHQTFVKEDSNNMKPSVPYSLNSLFLVIILLTIKLINNNIKKDSEIKI
jgi:hypothetical protein